MELQFVPKQMDGVGVDVLRVVVSIVVVLVCTMSLECAVTPAGRTVGFQVRFMEVITMGLYDSLNFPKYMLFS